MGGEAPFSAKPPLASNKVLRPNSAKRYFVGSPISILRNRKKGHGARPLSAQPRTRGLARTTPCNSGRKASLFKRKAAYGSCNNSKNPENKRLLKHLMETVNTSTYHKELIGYQNAALKDFLARLWSCYLESPRHCGSHQILTIRDKQTTRF